MNAKSLPGNKMLMTTGIVMVLLGLLLLISPAAIGAAVVKLVALVLVVTGVVQLVHGLQAGRTAHSIISIVLGLVVAGVGVLVWLNSALGSGFLTALLMLFFVVNGIYKLSAAIRYRGIGGWLWLFLSGLVSLLFVYLLWKQWPLSGAWAIGVLVGLDLLLTGLAMMVLAVAVKKARSAGYFDTIRL